MRTQEERDEQTLDIMSAVLGGVLFLVLPLGVVIGVGAEVSPILGLALLAGYVAVVVIVLRRRRR